MGSPSLDAKESVMSQQVTHIAAYSRPSLRTARRLLVAVVLIPGPLLERGQGGGGTDRHVL